MHLFQIIIVAGAIIAYVVFPGLMVTFALFPKKEDLDSVERAGLSTVLGLAPVFLLYFLDKNFSIPITSSSTLAMFFLVSLSGYAGWQYRKRRA